MNTELPLTKKVQELLDAGKHDEAARLHNATVKAQMEKAEKGEMINLTDLLASKEELHLRARR